MQQRIEIIIAEDHKLIRQNLISLLRDYSIFTIAEAENGIELLEKLKKNKPDVILLDIEMPEMDGYVAFEKLILLYPSIRVIFMSTHNEGALVDHLFDKGAKAFLSKNADMDVVVDTIISVHNNKKISNQIIESQKRKSNQNIKFSKRQAEVSTLICDGKSNKEIAEKLNITTKSVEAHKNNLFKKTKTRSAVSFVSYVLKKGLNYLK